ADNRRTGSFLLIDPADGTTLTAGMAGEAFGTAGNDAPDEEDWV
ncbi:sulfate adenylyltransferase subunit 1 (EFTu-like GTPase family), partial [Kitasatospora sp. GP82]|nr:sulfate adenylyltransferase subunit 1 (EFTu-like GTPase family) [Kitasatospora sp. GP82]